MTVWTVFLYDYESSRILGVYLSKEAAVQAITELSKEQPHEHWDVNAEVEKWEVI